MEPSTVVIPSTSSSSATKRYPCLTCKKTFSKASNLSRHRRVCMSSEIEFGCDRCGMKLSRKDSLLRHLRSCQGIKPDCSVQCSHCHRTFMRPENMRHHVKMGVCTTPKPPKSRKTYPCENCLKRFTFKQTMERHQKRCCGVDLRSRRSIAERSDHPRDERGVISIQSAFNKNLITYFVENIDEVGDLDSYLTMAFELMREKIQDHLKQWSSVSVNFAIDAIYEKPPPNESRVERNFKTRSVPVYEESDIDQILHDGIDYIAKEIEAYEGKGSGYTLSMIAGVVLNVSKFNPLRAACNMPLPKWIVKTRSCDHAIHPPTNDCFRHAILVKTLSKKEYDFSSMTFPTPLKDINKFEVLNDVSVNVYALDEENKVYPVRVGKTGKDEHFDLLLLSNGEDNHFVRIFDFERLVRSQLTKCREAIIICRRCFCFYDDRGEPKEDKLRRHQESCNDKPARIIMPSGDNNALFFKNNKYQLRLPFVVYADVESLLVPLSGCQPNPTSSYTSRYQEHQMMSYCVYVKSDIHEEGSDSDFNTANVYVGKDAATHLVRTLMRIGAKVMDFYSMNEPVEMTSANYENFHNATLCHFCKRPFTEEDPKVLDHDRIRKNYRGASHRSCNVEARQPNFLPVFFHNGSGYDFKFLVREMGHFPGEIQVIPHTEEKYISFSKRIDHDVHDRYIWLRFLDSCRFLPHSLDAIVKTLEPHQFKILPELFHGRKLELLLQKGQMPYEYMTEWEKLDDAELPPPDKFYSSLTESGITSVQYQHALDVWEAFNIQTLGQYGELYLKTDTYLLAEVFESFRREFLLSEYSVDPVYYYSLPGLAFDGMMKITGIKLELLSDYDMLLLIERGIRGGFTQVSKRHAVTDNDWQLLYIDANNLYGWASCQPLPVSNFTWVDPQSINLLSVPDDAEIGYIAEVDILVPEQLHDYFNEYPPLPEQLKLPGSKYTKLVGTLFDKARYVLHYRMLQFVVAHGCKVSAVHRVVGFRQSRWLAPFIDVNTEKRKVANSEFEKDLWKLLNNANFGKTIEQVRNRMDMRLLSEWSKAEKLIAKPNYLRRTIIEENLVAIHMAKTQIKFNKPIYAGFVILDMAKLKMLSFHYDIMLKHFGPTRLEKTYTDTDSFVYRVKTRRRGEDWRIEVFENLNLRQHFDFSNLSTDHSCYSNENKKVLGKFKDELEGGTLREWIGLRSKLYSMVVEHNGSPPTEVKKAKGIKKNAIKNKLTVEDYRRVLLEGETKSTDFNAIRSYRQRLFTVAIRKLALSSSDDKRHFLPDGVSTLAHGHYRIMDAVDDDDSGEDG